MVFAASFQGTALFLFDPGEALAERKGGGGEDAPLFSVTAKAGGRTAKGGARSRQIGPQGEAEDRI